MAAAGSSGTVPGGNRYRSKVPMMAQQPFGSINDPATIPWYDQPDRKRGSGCLKVLLITTVIGGMALVGCCVGAGFYFKNALISEPAEVEQLSRELIDWEFNNELSPVFAIDSMFVKVVLLGDVDKGALMMVHTGIFGGVTVGDPVRLSETPEFRFGEKSDREDTVILEAGERTIEVGDYKLNLEFNKTQGLRSKLVYWEVAGVFPGSHGPVIAALQLRESAYSDSDIERLIRAIKLP
jgi:hypothetical protein